MALPATGECRECRAERRRLKVRAAWLRWANRDRAVMTARRLSADVNLTLCPLLSDGGKVQAWSWHTFQNCQSINAHQEAVTSLQVGGHHPSPPVPLSAQNALSFTLSIAACTTVNKLSVYLGK